MGFDTRLPQQSKGDLLAQEQLAQGRPVSALRVWAQTWFGARWGTWTPLATLEARVEAWCRRERDRRRLAVTDDQIRRRCVRPVCTLLRGKVVPTLSHWRFNTRLYEWKHADADWHTLEEAEAMIEAQKARSRAGGQAGLAVRREEQALRQQRIGQLILAQPRSTRWLAAELGVTPRTIRRDLEALGR